MEIKIKEFENNSVTLQLNGRLNIEEVQYFEKEFEKYITKKKFIALDLSGVKYIDSSGIGSLIKAMNMAKNINVEFILFDINPVILNIFKLAYLDKFFTILSKQDLTSRFPQFQF